MKSPETIDTKPLFNRVALGLQPHYSLFKVAERLLFTGHSHQAWPNRAFDFINQYRDDTANMVDEKWEPAFSKVEKLRNYLRMYYQDPDGQYVLGINTHFLLCAFLSALKPYEGGGHFITTDAEFHTIGRQLKALKQSGADISYIIKNSGVSFIEQLENLLKPNTKAVLISRVFFLDGTVTNNFAEIAALLRQHGVLLLIDDYHGTNVLPLSLKDEKLEDCYMVTGGYKYLQWGEGNCFLRYPKNCELKPVITGWFASFGTLTEKDDSSVLFGDPNFKFASGTYDSASQYRACEVVDFFTEHNLTPQLLWQNYAEQRKYFKKLILNSQTAPLLPDETSETGCGGFISLCHPAAGHMQKNLNAKGVLTDSRGKWLRFGFAPYISVEQMEKAVQILEEVYAELSKNHPL